MVALPVCPPAKPAPAQLWITADYLLWWINNSSLPPLLTTGSLNDPRPGVAGQPGTRTLIGGDVSLGAFSGLRLQLGGWLTEERTLGIEASGFFLSERSRSFTASADATGSPLLSRPFVNLDGTPGVFDVAFPDALTGSLSATVSTKLHGWDVNLIANLVREDSLSVDALVGFRALTLDERLEIRDDFRALAPGLLFFQGTAAADSSLISVFDQFALRNRFYGPQIGGKLTWNASQLNLELVTKVAVGTTQQVAQIGGSTTLSADGTRQTASGGVLALASNSGEHDRNVFAVVPEVGLNLGYQLKPWLTLGAGYNVLYWSNVARPGKQIDTTINPALVPGDPTFGAGGPNRPAFSFRDSALFAHGLNFTAVFRY